MSKIAKSKQITNRAAKFLGAENRFETDQKASLKTTTKRFTIPKSFQTLANLSLKTILLASLVGCVHLVAKFDAITYKSLTDLKAETLLFLDGVDGTKGYEQYTSKCEDLQLKIEKVYEYEKGKSLNTDTISQIKEIKDMFSGLMKTYKEKNKLSAIYLTEKRSQLEAAFDLAISTENSKSTQ